MSLAQGSVLVFRDKRTSINFDTSESGIDLALETKIKMSFLSILISKKKAFNI